MSTNGIPLELLEQQAAEQRNQINRSVDDLRQLKDSATTVVRETLDLKRQARQHFWPAVGIASAVGLVLGHGLASVFFD